MTTKEYLIDEYNRTYIHYKALKAMLKSEGIESGNNTTNNTQSQEQPKPQETQTQTQTQQEVKPESTEPEVIYNGKSEYILTPGDTVKFSVYVNNVTSSRDYSVETVGDPTFFGCEEVGYKTSNGFRLDFDIKAKNYGKGNIKVYLTKNRSNGISIDIYVK